MIIALSDTSFGRLTVSSTLTGMDSHDVFTLPTDLVLPHRLRKVRRQRRRTLRAVATNA